MPYPPTPVKPDQISSGVIHGDDALDTANKTEAAIDRLMSWAQQLNSFVKKFSNPDGTLKTQILWQHTEIPTEQVETGDGVTLTWNWDTPIDPATDFVRVTTDTGSGEVLVAATNFVQTPTLVTTDNYTYTSSSITLLIAPPSTTTTIRFRVFYNWNGALLALNQLANDTVNALYGANLVAFDDPDGIYTADTVGAALTEVMDKLNDFLTTFGSVLDYLRSDGTRKLTGNWDANTRSGSVTSAVAATGWIKLNGNPNDGDTITISDGVITETFEFDNNATVTPGNHPIIIPGTSTPADQLAMLNNIDTNMGVLLMSIYAVASLTGDAAPLATAILNLTNLTPGTVGNVAITKSDFASAIEVSGMSGGTDNFYALTSAHRIRNLPPSLQDGDVVVHEQWRALQSAIDNIGDVFLRTDGQNTPVASISWGNNQLTDLANGTASSHAINLSQLNAAVASLNALIDATIHQTGTKAGVPRGTLTGPLTLGKLATDVADSDQTTTPATVAVHTIHGVPTPSEDDHVANKKYVDDTLSGLNFSKMFGTGELGAVVNPSWTDIGIYDCESLEISAPVTLPWLSIIRVRGNCTISNTATVTRKANTISASDEAILLALGAPIIRCSDSTTQGGGDQGGGGSLGLLHGAQSNNSTVTNRLGAGGNVPGGGGSGLGGPATKASLSMWKTLPLVFGGASAASASAGGVCVLLVAGDLLMTGGVINADGRTPTSGDAGGGAGGYIAVHCNGVLTDGTFEANGGDGDDNTAQDGGGGAAGVVVIRTRDVAGTPNVIAGGGNAVNDENPEAGSGSYFFRVTVNNGGLIVATLPGGNSAVSYDGTDGVVVPITLTDNQFDQLSVPWLE